MTSRELCPRTLRWAVRRLRSQARGFDDLVLRAHHTVASHYRALQQEVDRAADDLLAQARATEKTIEEQRR